MKRRKRVSSVRRRDNIKEVKYFSDWQTDWSKYIPELKNYELKSVDFLSIAGDAPKDFVYDREYRPGHRSRQNPRDKHIAKVGSKYYPLESVIEHLITRIGQCFGLCIADSKLRTIDGQVRFLSKFFLGRQQQLTHGAEIYEYSLGRENYGPLRDEKKEAEYFTFQMTCETITELLPDDDERIIRGYVKMLAFDAVIGHTDRHPYNWGVIVPISKHSKPRFAPVYDTARALFWNIPERRVVQMLSDKRQFEKYLDDCRPPIGWDHRENVDFFELMALVWKEFPQFREHIEKFLEEGPLEGVAKVLESEFKELISDDRRKLIGECLHQRQSRLRDALTDVGWRP